MSLWWLWPPGCRAWCVSDCTDNEHSWRGWVVVLWHRGRSTYVLSTDRRRALWIDWSRGHLFRDAPSRGLTADDQHARARRGRP